jgi:hypothetical protein
LAIVLVLMISFIKSESGLFVFLLLLNEKNRQQNKRISDMFIKRVFIFRRYRKLKKTALLSKLFRSPKGDLTFI